jgi:hypothetical protein
MLLFVADTKKLLQRNVFTIKIFTDRTEVAKTHLFKRNSLLINFFENTADVEYVRLL